VHLDPGPRAVTVGFAGVTALRSAWRRPAVLEVTAARPLARLRLLPVTEG
jgi:hypothetical protein